MRLINKIILHCAATKPSMDIGTKEIREWHLARGWVDIGYHFVIRRNGLIERGRALEQVGAHTTGHNAESIGICLVGGIDEKGKAANNFTSAQWESVENLLLELRHQFPKATIHGHREFAPKDCPCFDVQKYVASHPELTL